jgi:hypothetical protein
VSFVPINDIELQTATQSGTPARAHKVHDVMSTVSKPPAIDRAYDSSADEHIRRVNSWTFSSFLKRRSHCWFTERSAGGGESPLSLRLISTDHPCFRT